jgi:hypothetical protein
MKGSYLPLTANAKPPLPPTMLSKVNSRPPSRSARSIDKALSVLTVVITLVGLCAWLQHAIGIKFTFQTTSSAAAPTSGPLTSLASMPLQPANPAFGTLAMYCEKNVWAGRTGNNLISIFSAALRAHVLGMDFKIIDCSHDLLDLSHFTLSDTTVLDVKESHAMTTAEAFKTFVASTGMRILPKEACCLRKSILSPLVKKIATSPAASKYHPDSLIIHIRSGDIYRAWPPPHSNYAPPPLAFYSLVIEEHQSRHSTGASVVIVTEIDNMSPLVEALLKQYPEDMIALQAGTLEEDVAVVLAARHLVASQGTFAYALAFASEQLATLYTFNKNLDTRVLCDAEQVRYRAVLPAFLDTWAASSEQIQYLLEYPAENLTRSSLKPNKSYCGTI